MMQPASALNLRPLYRSLTEALRAVAGNLQDFVSNPGALVPEALIECAQVSQAMHLLATQRFCETCAELAFSLREKKSVDLFRLLASAINAIGIHMRALAEGSSVSYSALNKSYFRLSEGIGRKSSSDAMCVPMFKTLEASYGWIPPSGSGRTQLALLLRANMAELAEMDGNGLREFLKRLESRNADAGVKVFIDAAMCVMEMADIPEQAMRAIGCNLARLASQENEGIDVGAVSTLLMAVRSAGLTSARSLNLVRNVLAESPSTSVDVHIALKFAVGLDRLRELFKKAAGSGSAVAVADAVQQFVDGSARLGSPVVANLCSALLDACKQAGTSDPGNRLWVAGAMAVIVARHAVDMAVRGLSEHALLGVCSQIESRLLDPSMDAMAPLDPPQPMVDQVRLGAISNLCEEAEKDIRATQSLIEDALKRSDNEIFRESSRVEYSQRTCRALETVANVLKTLSCPKAAGMCMRAADTAVDPQAWSNPPSVQYLTEVTSALSLLFSRLRGGSLAGMDDLINAEISSIEHGCGSSPKEAASAEQTLETANRFELLEVFLEEAEELVALAQQALQMPGAEWVDTTARLVHTLSGGARVAGAVELGNALSGARVVMDDLADEARNRTPVAHEVEPDSSSSVTKEIASECISIVTLWLATLKREGSLTAVHHDLTALDTLFGGAPRSCEVEVASVALDIVSEVDEVALTISPKPASSAFERALAYGVSSDAGNTASVDVTLKSDEVMPQAHEITCEGAEIIECMVIDKLYLSNGTDVLGDFGEALSTVQLVVSGPDAHAEVDVNALRAVIIAAISAAADRPDRMEDSELMIAVDYEVEESAKQILETAEDWMAGSAEAADIVAVRRHVHTIKGAVRTAGMMRIGAALHALEDLLDDFEGQERGLLKNTALAELFADVAARCRQAVSDLVGDLLSGIAPTRPFNLLVELPVGRSAPSVRADDATLLIVGSEAEAVVDGGPSVDEIAIVDIAPSPPIMSIMSMNSALVAPVVHIAPRATAAGLPPQEIDATTLVVATNPESAVQDLRTPDVAAAQRGADDMGGIPETPETPEVPALSEPVRAPLAADTEMPESMARYSGSIDLHLEHVSESDIENFAEHAIILVEVAESETPSKANVDPSLAAPVSSVPPLEAMVTAPISVPRPPTIAQVARAPGGAMMRVAVDTVANLGRASGEATVLQRRTMDEVADAWIGLKDLENHLERTHGLIKELEIEAEVRIQAGRASAQEGPFDALEFDRFTRLQEVTRSLSENIADITNSANAIGECLGRVSEAEDLRDTLADEIQEEAARLMVAPLAVHKGRLERVVALACDDAGKLARLRLLGDAEVPGPVMDRLLPALEHILRNCVAHGIERPERRVALSKAPEGSITMEIRQVGPGLSIVISDDGAGIDQDKVLSKAYQNGIASATLEYNAEQVFAMLFSPGFTTSPAVSKLAGRGIGLDVVKTIVAEIGGLVKLASVKGEGTTISVSAPADISTMTVVPITVGATVFMLPAALVDRLSTLRTADMGANVVASGVVHRVVDFARFAGVIRESTAASMITSLVIMGSDSSDPVAFVVDSVQAQRKVVVRPLGRHISSIPGLIAGTVIGDGSPVLIVNPMRMRDLGSLGTSPEESAQIVLLVDDSSTVRLSTAKALRKAGFEVVTATDGIDALEKLDRGLRPDAFAFDLEMPRLDGFELTREVRRKPEFSNTPIFIVSSRVGQKHRDHVLALGATDFLGKPVQAQELASRIREHIEKAEVASR